MTRSARSTQSRQEQFLAALDELLRGPDLAQAPTGRADVATSFGTTRVTSWGTAGGAPVVLLPGHGATSAAWAGVARRLGRTRRVHALELVGDAANRAGDPLSPADLSTPATQGPRTRDDLVGWLDQVLRAVVPDGDVVLAGHSYGAWLALSFALARPGAVARLVLVDPTDCFGGPSLGYVLRALPLIVRPTPGRWESFVRWETRGAEVDARWLEVSALGAGLPIGRVVRPSRPRPVELDRLSSPTLVLLASRSRAHDVRRVAERARDVPAVTVERLSDASHHSVPAGQADELAAVLDRWATPERPPAGGPRRAAPSGPEP